MCVGIPGRIVEINDPEHNIATVEIGGIKRKINIACVVDKTHTANDCMGDWVLVHVGFAMSRIDEQEAAATLALLTELGEIEGELQELVSSSGAAA